MNTSQIYHALETNNITAETFQGVYSSDTVPKFVNSPSGCVVNTDPQGKPGTHWVALYQEQQGVIETFDSFVKDLLSYSHYFKEFANSSRIISQSHQLQSEITTVCGQYCLFFLLRRCSNETYSQIIHLYTDNKASNDIMVCQYVDHYFDLNTEVQDKRFLNQVARMFTELR